MGFLLQNILAISAILINKKQKSSLKLQKVLAERQNEVFQVRVAKGLGGHFLIQNGHIRFSRNIHSNPNFEQVWKSGLTALKTLLSKDETDFLRAFEAGQYDFQGDFTLAIWFNEVMKIVQA